MSLPLVLLPGMMCDARLFGPQIEALSGQYSIHLGTISAHSTTRELAAAVLAHAPPKFALAGLSMGGIVAMEIFEQSPDRVDRLALMDTNPRADTAKTRSVRDHQISRAEKGELKTIIGEDMKPNYISGGPLKEQILDLCMDMALGLGTDVFIRQSKALQQRPDRRETLRNVKVPTLVLCGDEDALCPIERHEEIQSLVLGSKLEIIKSAGHLPSLEQPKATTAAIRRWMEE